MKKIETKKRGRPFGSTSKAKPVQVRHRHIQEAPPIPNIELMQTYEPPEKKPVAFTGRKKKTEKLKVEARKNHMLKYIKVSFSFILIVIIFFTAIAIFNRDTSLQDAINKIESNNLTLSGVNAEACKTSKEAYKLLKTKGVEKRFLCFPN